MWRLRPGPNEFDPRDMAELMARHAAEIVGTAPRSDELVMPPGRASPFLRARLAEAVEMKRVPDLRFVFDGIAAPGTKG